jgi:UTP--glucose-1-phosphate uridylyltransferase
VSRASFAPCERKLREAGAPALAIASFRRAFEALVSGEKATLSRAEIEPVAEVPDAEAQGDARRAGEAALARCVVIKLNGGLGTSMGMTRAKSLLPVKDGLSFLDVTARQIGRLRERTGVAVPLVLMNSFRTRADSLAALAKYGKLSGPLAPDFLQHKVPRLALPDLAPVAWPSEPEHEWCPPGHGDIYPALATSGLLGAMLAAGYRSAFVSNADNLGAVLEPALLGWFVASGAPFAMEVKARAQADKKGGHLARTKDGRLTLREVAQCPPEERESFEDTALWRWFNTNNLWIDLPALSAALEAHAGVLPLPLIHNEKPVDPEDPASPRVLQLETAMGAAISVFEGARAIRVPDARFAPVKTTADLLRVRSDAYLRDAEERVLPAPGGLGGALAIELDPAFFRTVDELDARTPHGPPSLLRCRRLVVRGDVRFGRGVVLEGEVTLAAPAGGRLDVPDGARLGAVPFPTEEDRPLSDG